MFAQSLKILGAHCRGAVARVFRDRKGVTAVMAALMATGFVGASGLAVDVGGWYAEKHALQAAADAAASGGALALYEGQTNSQAQTAATTDATLNLTGLAAGATVESPAVNTSDTVSVNSNGVVQSQSAESVTVTITKPANLFLAGLFLKTAPTIQVTSKDAVVNNGQYLCGFANGGNSGTGSFSVSSASTVSCPSGAVVDNSGNNNSGTINSGTYCGPNGSKAATSGQESQCQAFTDSLSSNPPAPTTYCHYFFFSQSTCYAIYCGVNYGTTSFSSGSHTLSAGIYCGGINVSGSATVTLNPGTYVIYNGGLSSSGSATIKNNTTGGDGSGGVSIYVTGDSPNSSTQPIDLESSGGTKLTAPTSGGMAGVVVSVDNSSSMCNGQPMTNTLGGKGSVDLSGVAYFGSHTVNVTGSSAQNATAQYTMLEAGSVNITNTSTVNLKPYSSSSSVPLPSGYTFNTPQVVKVE